jgi:integrase
LSRICRARSGTIDGYRSYVKFHIAPVVGKIQLQRLRPEHIRAMMAEMSAKGLSPATIRQAHAILRAALAAAVEDGRLASNPSARATAKPPTVKKNPHAILSAADALKVINAADDTRIRARLAVAIMCGLRQGEALALRWSDVHEAGNTPWLNVCRSLSVIKGRGRIIGDVKSAASVRRVPLSKAAAFFLAAWREESGGAGLVFPASSAPDAPRDPSRDAKDWRAALQAAGVTHVPLHGARGTAATIMANSGISAVDIAHFLGHAQVTTTLAHYVLTTDEGVSRAVAQLDAAIPALTLRAG